MFLVCLLQSFLYVVSPFGNTSNYFIYRDIALKLLKILIITVFLLVSTLANATLLKSPLLAPSEMTDSHYITVEHAEVTLAWAWASNYNVQRYTEFGDVVNDFHSADTVAGWRLATDDEIEYFNRDITASSFLDLDSGKYKTAIAFFNSNPAKGFSVSDFNAGDISFNYTDGSTMDQYLSYTASGVFDTFYVSDTIPTTSGPKPIPEPLTILLFAVAFIIMQSKLRKKSA